MYIHAYLAQLQLTICMQLVDMLFTSWVHYIPNTLIVTITKIILLCLIANDYFPTQDQFMFIHDAILESVTCGDTQIAATNLRSSLNRMKKKDPLNQLNTFQHQFQVKQSQNITIGLFSL